MKFTQSSFPFYLLGLSSAFTYWGYTLFRNWFGFFGGGLGLMLYVLKLFRFFQQILSGLVVNVDSILDHLGRGFESYCLSHQFFFLSD